MVKPPPPAASVTGKAAKPKSEPKIRKDIKITSGRKTGFFKVAIHGKGGTGKSTLAAQLKLVGINPLFIDLNNGTDELDVDRISMDEIEDFDGLRGVLQNKELLSTYNAVVIDTATEVVELAERWTLANIKNSKGYQVDNLKSYGWAEGDSHLFDTFLQFLGDMDALNRTHHVVVILHSVDTNVSNAGGENYLASMPVLPNPRKGDISSKFIGWIRHLFFLEIERFITDGKAAVAEPARIIRTTLMPHFEAKSTIEEDIVFEKDVPELWTKLLKGVE